MNVFDQISRKPFLRNELAVKYSLEKKETKFDSQVLSDSVRVNLTIYSFIINFKILKVLLNEYSKETRFNSRYFLM